MPASVNLKHIDFHIMVDPKVTVEEIHQLIGEFKKQMNDELKFTRVNVHVDPYRAEGKN